MSGYASRTKPFEKVAADLYVKALVLEDRDGHRAVLVTSDLLGFPAEVAEPICARLQKKIGLQARADSSQFRAHPRGTAAQSEGAGQDDPNSGEALRTDRIHPPASG